jgi:hypothetical protein
MASSWATRNEVNYTAGMYKGHQSQTATFLMPFTKIKSQIVAKAPELSRSVLIS